LHEAGLLAAAVAEALAAGPPEGRLGPGDPGALRPTAVTVRVHDPMHVAPESAVLHAEVALRERGLDGIPIAVEADPVTCAICEASNEVRPNHPFCDACGFPLPDRGGHAVDVSIEWGPAPGETVPDPAMTA
jgi:hypothetical protein